MLSMSDRHIHFLDATEVFIAVLIACSTCFGHHYALHYQTTGLHLFYQCVICIQSAFEDGKYTHTHTVLECDS